MLPMSESFQLCYVCCCAIVTVYDMFPASRKIARFGVVTASSIDADITFTCSVGAGGECREKGASKVPRRVDSEIMGWVRG